MKDLLQVAAQSGSGSAARALGGGLAGISRRTRRLCLILVAGLILVFAGWDSLAALSSPSENTVSVVEPTAVPTPAPPVGQPSGAAPTKNAITYAIDVREIAGLSEATAPGTIIDLWVTWDPPLTDVPELDRLIRGAMVTKMTPPVTPEGSYVAVLAVDQKQVENLLWADRYGSLSATVRSN